MLSVFSYLLVSSYYTNKKKKVLPPKTASYNVSESIIKAPSVDEFYTENTIISPSRDIKFSTQDKADVYTYSPVIIDEPKLYTLGEILGMQLLNTKSETFSDEQENQIILADQNSQLIYSDYYNSISYLTNPETTKEKLNDMVDLDSYDKKAQEYLQKINMGNYIFKYYRFLDTSDFEADTQNLSKNADMVEVTYELEHLGIPLINRPETLIPNKAVFWFDKNYNLKKLTINPGGGVGSKTDEIEIISQEQILDDINNKKLEIVNTDTSLGEKILSSTITDIKLSYLNDKGKLIPIYIIIGKSKTQNSEANSYFYLIAENTKEL